VTLPATTSTVYRGSRVVRPSDQSISRLGTDFVVDLQLFIDTTREEISQMETRLARVGGGSRLLHNQIDKSTQLLDLVTALRDEPAFVSTLNTDTEVALLRMLKAHNEYEQTPTFKHKARLRAARRSLNTELHYDRRTVSTTPPRAGYPWLEVYKTPQRAAQAKRENAIGLSILAATIVGSAAVSAGFAIPQRSSGDVRQSPRPTARVMELEILDRHADGVVLRNRFDGRELDVTCNTDPAKVESITGPVEVTLVCGDNSNFGNSLTARNVGSGQSEGRFIQFPSIG
jgi:hypothetical protein